MSISVYWQLAGLVCVTIGWMVTVFIHSHFWREKYLGKQKNITIDSNCDEVELFVNDRSLGKRYPRKEDFFTLDYENMNTHSQN